MVQEFKRFLGNAELFKDHIQQCGHDTQLWHKELEAQGLDQNLFELTEEEKQIAGNRSILPSVALLGDYIPDRDAPLTYLCVNIHFIADDNGNGVSYLDVIDNAVVTVPITPFNYKRVARELLAPSRGIFGGSTQPSDPADCPASAHLTQGVDSRIRPTLKGTYFHRDSALSANSSLSQVLNGLFQIDPDYQSAINIIVANNGLGGAYTFMANSNPATDHGVIGGNLSGIWGSGQLLAHELGHILGLNHTYLGGGASAVCDESQINFMADIHGCSQGALVCPHTYDWGADAFAQHGDGITNNLMGGNISAGWLSTMQIGWMHYILQTRASLEKYLSGCCACAAFGAYTDSHTSQGADTDLAFDVTLSDEVNSWNGHVFSPPSDGTYRFSLAFEKEGYNDGGTDDDVSLHLRIRSLDGTSRNVNSAWAGQGPRRVSASMTNNIELKLGDLVSVFVHSDGGKRRHIRQIHFAGEKLCCK